MATATYNYDVPSEYTVTGVAIVTEAELLVGFTTGTALANLPFKAYGLTAFVPTETLSGGEIRYGLEIDTVLSYWDGLAWSPSDGSGVQLNTLAVLQANLDSAAGSPPSVIRPFARLSRTLITDPSPVLHTLVVTYEATIPNQQVLMATDPAVALNTGVGGVPSPGDTRVTLDPSLIKFALGTNELFVFLNGQLRTCTKDYVEEDTTHVVFNFLLDAVGPQIDEVEFRSIMQGSSEFIEPPTSLLLAQPSERPDNFGGMFSFV